MNFDLLAKTLAERKEPKFRLAQAKRAFFVDFSTDWDQVSVFSKPLRDALKEAVAWDELTPVKTQESSDGRTIKTLFACADGKKIEAVLMRHEGERNTVCVSSQVGCAMACGFCATGTMGLTRNLTKEEIVGQVIHFARWLKPKNDRVTNVVLMGMGEPFHNYDQVMSALRTLNDPEGFNLGARHMSVSTCGIVPGILKLAEEDFQVNLAISLHSAIQDERSEIMPVNRAYPLHKLMQAVRTYMAKTNRKVMFEYLLLKGKNDCEEDAQALAELFGPDYRLVHVNLIKYHETDAFKGTLRDQRMQFLDRLHELGVPATHRITFGEDIDAACGQLAVNEQTGTLKQGLDAVRAVKIKV
jgi:23S rRNA (adenine2503-C2)-methyltransferase